MNPSDEVATQRKENRKMLIWFIVALIVALLPWLLLS
jgi:hypothetical protein